ncbi:MAG: hypothetical protein FWC00_05620 [Firmicutes bacterium]|nr:hypothetical protein [Bacillota bacterium]
MKVLRAFVLILVVAVPVFFFAGCHARVPMNLELEGSTLSWTSHQSGNAISFKVRRIVTVNDEIVCDQYVFVQSIYGATRYYFEITEFPNIAGTHTFYVSTYVSALFLGMRGQFSSPSERIVIEVAELDDYQYYVLTQELFK